MYKQIQNYLDQLATQFEQISDEHKRRLNELSQYIRSGIAENKEIKLVFICTHNSRRSHFGQIAAAISAQYYHVENISVYSGGTEVSAFHPNAIQALISEGFEITNASDSVNPVYHVRFGENTFTSCFSKLYTHEVNPTNNFAAILTCADADENCPQVYGAEIRMALPYDDPKKSDRSAAEAQTYKDRFKEITREILYLFSQVKNV